MLIIKSASSLILLLSLHQENFQASCLPITTPAKQEHLKIYVSSQNFKEYAKYKVPAMKKHARQKLTARLPTDFISSVAGIFSSDGKLPLNQTIGSVSKHVIDDDEKVALESASQLDSDVGSDLNSESESEAEDSENEQDHTFKKDNGFIGHGRPSYLKNSVQDMGVKNYVANAESIRSVNYKSFPNLQDGL